MIVGVTVLKFVWHSWNINVIILAIVTVFFAYFEEYLLKVDGRIDR